MPNRSSLWLTIVVAVAAAVAFLPVATPQPAQDGVSARQIVETAQLTPAEEEFYVCPPPTGATLMRLEPPRACPSETEGRDWREGIAVLFKENIQPHKFKALLYYKNIISTTTWSGSTYKQITSRYSDRTPVDFDEITTLIDTEGKCSSKAKYLRNNREVEAFDKDEDAKNVDLVESKFSTHTSRAWHTTNETYTVFGSPWTYRAATSVNCIVEEIDARSSAPFDYFALANGDVVNSSPFYGLGSAEAASEHMGYSSDRFFQNADYLPFNLTTRQKLTTPVRRNWIMTPSYTVAWNWQRKTDRVCSMARWRVVDEMLRARYPGNRMRFVAKTLSAAFISNATEFDPDRIKLGQCVRADSRRAVDEVYTAKYNETHVKSGPIQYYLAVGGYIVAFQPILAKSLAGMYIRELLRDNRTDVALDLLSRQNGAAPTAAPAASLVRLRRDAAGLTETTAIRSTSSAQFAMLQYVYDTLQQHVNENFRRLAAAWCELQNREAVLWTEGLRLNPAAVASANLGRRVGAKVIGDVLAVSSCFIVDSASVTLQNTMRSPLSPNTCYSRPLVRFSYRSDEAKIDGQLGENNELLPSVDLIEPCVANQRRYFLYGAAYALFEDYTFVRMVEMADVPMLSTFVDLNLTMLEDREILPLQVYTKEEIRDSGVLDYAEVSRRNHLHDLKFYDIDKVIEVDTNYAFMSGLAELFNGLGTAGKAIGKVVVGAAGAVVSTVSGVASFLSNPFGGLAVGLLVIAAIVAAFLAYRYINQLRSNPMKTLYPLTTKNIKNGDSAKKKTPKGRRGGDEEEDDDDDDDDFIDEDKLEQAREMVKYLTYLSAAERMEKKKSKKRRGTTSKIADRFNDLRLRSTRRLLDGARNGPLGPRFRGYDRLDEADFDDDFADHLTLADEEYDSRGESRV